MAIITYECDSTPMGVRKRFERKNTKADLARALQEIHFARTDETLTDIEKLNKIREAILNVL